MLFGSVFVACAASTFAAAEQPAGCGSCGAAGELPAGFALYGSGGRPERLGREQCERRGLCAYADERQLVEQYTSPSACEPAAPEGSTCCAASGGAWTPYAWSSTACAGAESANPDRAEDAAPSDAQIAAEQAAEELAKEKSARLVAEIALRAAAEQQEALIASAAEDRRRLEEREQQAAELESHAAAVQSDAERRDSERQAAQLAAAEEWQRVVEQKDGEIEQLQSRARRLNTLSTVQEAARVAAEEEAQALLDQKTAELEAAEKGGARAVEEKSQRIAELAAQLQAVSDAAKAEKRARVAAEVVAAQLRVDREQTLSKIVAQHKLTLAERQTQIESLEARATAAQEAKDAERARHLAVEAKAERHALEKEAVLLAAAEERQRVSAATEAQLEQLRSDSSRLAAEREAEKTARVVAEQQSTVLIAEKNRALDKSKNLKRVAVEQDQQLQQLQSELQIATAERDAERTARIAAEQDATATLQDKEEALREATDERQRIVAEKDAEIESLTKQRDTIGREREMERDARLAAELEAEAINTALTDVLAADEEQERLIVAKTAQIGELRMQLEMLTEKSLAEKASMTALEQEAAQLRDAGEAALVAMAAQEQEQMRLNSEKDQTIQELLEHAHSFSQARDAETASRLAVERTLKQLTAEKAQIVQAHEQERERLAVESNQTAQQLLDRAQKLRRERDGETAARTAAEDHIKRLRARSEAEAAAAQSDRDEAEAAHKRRVQELTVTIEETRKEVQAAQESLGAAKREAHALVVEHGKAISEAAELHANFSAESAKNQSQLEGRCRTLSSNVDTEHAARAAAEKRAEQVVADRALALAAAQEKHASLVKEHSKQIDELSARMANMSKARDTEATARAEAEEKIKLLKEQKQRELRASAAEHKRVLAEQLRYAEQLQGRIAAAHEEKDHEKEARLVAETTAQWHAQEAETALLAAGERQRRVVAEKDAEIERLRDESAQRLAERDAEKNSKVVVEQQAAVLVAEKNKALEKSTNLRRVTVEQDQQLQQLLAEQEALGAARAAKELELAKATAAHADAMAVADLQTAGKIAEKDRQIRDCENRIADLGERIAKSNATVTELLGRVEVLNAEKREETRRLRGELEAAQAAQALEQEQSAEHIRGLTERLDGVSRAHDMEKSTRVTAEQSLERLATEKAGEGVKHEQEKQMLLLEKNDEIKLLSGQVEHIKGEKKTEQRARMDAEDLARAERAAHREERAAMIAQQDRQIQDLTAQLEILGREASLARAASEEKMRQANDRTLSALLRSLSACVSSIVDGRPSDCQLRGDAGLYTLVGAVCMALAFAVLACASAKPALDAAELVLRASVDKQTMEDMLQSGSVGQSAAAPTTPSRPLVSLQLKGTMSLLLPDFGDWEDETLAKCLSDNVPGMRSAIVTQAAHGISLSIDAANASDIDRMCPEVEKALAEIVQEHLNVANPRVRVEHEQEPSGESRLLARIRADTLADARQLHAAFADGSLHAAFAAGTLKPQHPLGEAILSLGDMELQQALVARIRIQFIAHIRTYEQDFDGAAEALRSAIESGGATEVLWEQIGTDPEESLLIVEHLESMQEEAGAAPATPTALFKPAHDRTPRPPPRTAVRKSKRPSQESPSPGEGAGVAYLRGVHKRHTVDLSGVCLGDAGAVALASELRAEDCQLHSVNASGSAVGEIGLEALAAACHDNHTLTALCLVTSADVFFGRWDADQAAHDQPTQAMLRRRASLLEKMRAAVRRNQQALPRQMRFLEDDLKIFPEAFSAAGVQQQ